MSQNKFAPRTEGTKQEKLGVRSSEYSAWHRSLGREYLAVDIDFVEYRREKGIVALIDVTGNMENENHIINSKKYIWNRTSVQREILSKLSKSLGIPAFFVLHTKDLTVFHVHDLDDNLDVFIKMDKTEYGNFVKRL